MKEIYKTYDIEEILESKEVLAYLNNSLSSDESEAWEKWLTANVGFVEKLNEAKEIYNVLSSEENIAHAVDTKSLWTKINDEISENSSDTDQPKVIQINTYNYRKWISIAAVFVLLGSYIGYTYLMPITVESMSREQLVSVLPSGTNVDINAGSKLKYSKNGWSKQRNVYLEGEAFFNVTKGVPFKITTPEGSVEVLGTSFNVYARNGILDVEVASGTVRVVTTNDNKKEERILQKGDKIYVENGVAGIDKLEARSQWLSNKFNYENVEIEVVLDDISRKFGIEIKTDQLLEAKLFTGLIPMEEYDLALQALTWPLNLDFSESNGEVHIISKK